MTHGATAAAGSTIGSEPGSTGERRRRRPRRRRPGGGRRRRSRRAHAAQPARGAALGYSDRGADPARVRRGVRGARRRARADPGRRAGQDDPRGQDRAAQGGRHARALRGHAEGGPRRLRARPRRRASTAACCAGRSAWSAAIVPWNFPTTLLCNKLGPALLCGNTVVAKPADSTPLTTLRLGEILAEAGLPEGVLDRAPGHRRARPARRSSRTRSCARSPSPARRRPGERVAALAAKGSKRVTLELGGSDPMIICDDADLAKAASAASMGRFYNCGQACLAIKRVYVFESVADEVIEAIAAKAAKLRIGIGSEPGSQIGPLHSERQRDLLERQIADSGGEILAGGGRPDDPALANGWFHEPTVVLEPGHDSPMAQEEVFGPALPIWRVRDMDEAIERANDSPFGLGSSVWTQRPRSRRARGGRAGLRLHVDQLADQGLRRAAVRRPEGERLRQGARLRGLRLLHRQEIRRGETRMIYNASRIVDRHVESGRADKPAFIAADATLTYEQLRKQVNRAGGLLKELGVGREHRVLLVLDDTTAFPILFLGAMRIGAVPGAGQPPRQGRQLPPLRRGLLRHGGRDRRRDAAAAAAPSSPATTLRYLVRGGDGAGRRRARRRARRPGATSSTRRRRTATTWRSGSTARARPASRRAWCTCTTTSRSRARTTPARCSGCARTTSRSRPRSSSTPTGSGNGLSFPLWFGATSVLMRGADAARADPRDAARAPPDRVLLGARRCSARSCATRRPTARWTPCASACRRPRRCRRRRSTAGWSASASRSSTGSARRRCCTSSAPTGPGAVEPGTTGRAVPGYDLRIVDEAGSVLEGPAVGGLEVRGDSCAAFYWHQHEKTKSAMRGDWFASGDRYERRAGRRVRLRRADGRHAQDRRAVGVADRHGARAARPPARSRASASSACTIEDATRIAAFVECARATPADDALAEELRTWCKERLRRYEYPHIVEFVDELPRTLTGKVQRFALRELAAAEVARMRAAVIGAGPAGFYATDQLLGAGFEVDLFDALPTPFGLVRSGVAPDHPKLKSVTRIYEKTAAKPGFRFFGGVVLGEHVSRAELLERYHAVLYAIGTPDDNRLGIPGEDRPGSHSATEFVAWYNGHPELRRARVRPLRRPRGGDRQRQRGDRRRADARARPGGARADRHRRPRDRRLRRPRRSRRSSCSAAAARRRRRSPTRRSASSASWRAPT